MRLIPQRARRRHVFAAAGVATSVLMACWNDQPTSPPLRAVPTSPSFTTATALGTYSIPVSPNNFPNSGTQFITNTGIIIPAGTFFRARVVGSITVSRNSVFDTCRPTTPTPGTGTYGPGGLTNGELRVGVYYHAAAGGGSNPLPYLDMQAGSGAPDSAKTDIRFAAVATEIQVGRSGIGGSVGGPCVPGGGEIGAYDLAGSQMVIVEKITDVVHLVANPVAIKAPQQVTFTASRDDGGNFGVNSWWWDSDTGTDTGPCWWLHPCLFNVQGTGTMTVNTNVGFATARVIKYSNSMTLDADRSTVDRGDTVTFTPKYDGVAGPAARWRWVPDDTSTDTGVCPGGESQCKKRIRGPGAMWAYTSNTSGQGDSASAQVTVNPYRITLEGGGSLYLGDTATFSAGSTGGSLVVTSWLWRPPAGSVANAASSREHKAPLNPRFNLIRPRGRPSFGLGPSETTPSCGAAALECRDEVQASGLMWVFGTVDGVIDSTSVAVTLIPELEPDPNGTCNDEVSNLGPTTPFESLCSPSIPDVILVMVPQLVNCPETATFSAPSPVENVIVSWNLTRVGNVKSKSFGGAVRFPVAHYTGTRWTPTGLPQEVIGDVWCSVGVGIFWVKTS